MHAAIADAVNAFTNAGLSLRDRLEAGEAVQWDLERATLKQRLAVVDGGEDVASSEIDPTFVFSEQSNPEERGRLTHATIRYVLTCWMDEWFIHYSSQGSPWRERTLEAELFGSFDAGAKFWEEARYAETRADLDALEAMHLCVMLGFRGTWRDKPELLDAWTARIRLKLAQAAHPWAMPACLETPADTATPAADSPLRRMAFSVLLAFSLLLPFVAMLWWRF